MAIGGQSPGEMMGTVPGWEFQRKRISVPTSFSAVVKYIGSEGFAIEPLASIAETVTKYSVDLDSPWMRQLEAPVIIAVCTILVVVAPGI